MEMYMMEENHFGQVIQNALISIPMMATVHTSARSGYPTVSFNGMTQIGV